ALAGARPAFFRHISRHGGRQSALGSPSPEPSRSRGAVPTFAKRTKDAEAPSRPSASQLAILTCERCNLVHEMTVDSYRQGWPGGMRCGVCGPPYLLMRVRLVPAARAGFRLGSLRCPHTANRLSGGKSR